MDSLSGNTAAGSGIINEFFPYVAKSLQNGTISISPESKASAIRAVPASYKDGKDDLAACAAAPADLVACYPGEFTPNDSKGRNNGEWMGGYGYGAGKVGTGAFRFSGSNYIMVPDARELNPAKLTVDAWINLDDLGGVRNVVSKGDSAYVLQISDQRVRFVSRNKAGISETLETGDLIRANTWMHVAITHDGAMKRIYVNGEEVASGPQIGLQTNDKGTFKIGASDAPDESSTDKSFTGMVDDAKLFSRALTAKEIEKIFSAGRPNAPENITAFSVTPSTVVEGNAGEQTLTVSVTRDATDAGTAISVNFSAGGGTATGGASCAAGVDYVFGTPSVGYVAGETGTKTVPLTICSDTVPEPTETFAVSVAVVGSTETFPGPVTVTINDDDTTVSVAVSPVSVLEDSGAGMTYTFTRSSTGGDPMTVNWSVAGTAGAGPLNGCAGNDYTIFGGSGASGLFGCGPPVTGFTTFTAGSLTATIIVGPIADTVVEPNETVITTLIAGTGYVVGAPSVATGTITNDDSDVSVTVSPASVTEDGAANLVYTFARSGTSSTVEALTVSFTTTGTAVSGTDYTQTSTGTVVIPAASASATVTVDPTADNTVEADMTVILTATSCVAAPAGGCNVVAPLAATGTIANDDSNVSVAVATATSLEDTGPNMVYTFTRASGPTTNALVVNFSTTGTAGAGDFTQTSTGTVTILAASSTATVTVDPTTDIIVEPDETVLFTVTANGAPAVTGGYTPFAPTAATGTILDDDEDVTVTVAPATVLEDGAPNLVYTFTRIGTTLATSDTLSVNYSVGGTATNGTDYAAIASSVAFGAGVLTATVTVDPTADVVPENNETVIITVTAGTISVYGIGNPNSAPAGTQTATGTITNDDFAVSISVSPESVLEGSDPPAGDDGGVLTYTFTRVGETTGQICANFSSSGTGASALTDYTTSFGAVSTCPNGFTPAAGPSAGLIGIPGGAGAPATVGGVQANQATFIVTPTDDSGVELDEEVQIQVNPGVGYTPGTPNPASGLIVNDDTVVTVAVSPISSDEDLGPDMVYTFTRTANLGVALTVNYTVSGGAIVGDYTGTAPGAQTVSFVAGSPTATVSVNPTADTLVESDETVVFTLNAGTDYTVGAPSVATGTILNDDTDINVTLAGSPIFENATGVMTYTFTRTGLINGNLTVNFSTTGTATTGTDYVPSATGSVTITGTNTTAAVTVDPSPDSDVENDETVILTVVPGTGYNVGTVTPAQTGTITSDDVDVQLNAVVANTPVLEDGGNNLIYTIQRVGLSTTQEVTVPFTIGGGTNPATCGDDYDVSGTGVTFSNAAGCPGTGTAVIAAGNASTTVTVDPRPDLVVENDETVRVTLNSCAGSGASAGQVNTCDLVAATSVDGVITNDDTDVNVAIAPPIIVEDATGVMTYTFTRNTSAALLALPLTVNYNSSGTACTAACNDTFTPDFTVGLPAGSNYNGTNGTGTGATSIVVFAAGNSTTVITVDPTADLNIEPDETVTLTVIAGTGYTPVANTFATGTIRDEDSSVQFSSATYSGTEGSGGGTTPFTLTVTRTGPGSAIPAAAVDASTIQVGGTATGTLSCANAGTDYVVISGQTINWAAAEAGGKPFVITVCADDRDENNEILNSQLSNFIGTQIGSPLAAVTTITDDDAPPSFALTPATTTVAEGASATYTVTRSGNTTDLSTTVSWGTSNGTANQTADFTPTSGTVVFAAGTGGTQTFTIGAVADSLFEGSENFNVFLTGATNGSAFSGTNVTTITDGDTAPTVAIGDVTQVEGCINPAVCGQSAFIFTITRTGNAQANQTMTASTQDGGGATAATAPSDYTAIPGDTVTFTPGQTTRQVSVIVNGDWTFEDDETFRVNLAGFNFGSATDGTGLGTITNDDGAPVFTIGGSVTQNEGNSGTTNFTFTINKSGATQLSSIVSANTVDGSAVAGTDYVAIVNAAVANFNPSDTSKTFNVVVNGDTIYEGNDTFTVTLTNVTNGTFGTPISAVGTITNDELAPNFAFSSVTPTVTEGGTTAFLVTRSFPTGTTGTDLTSSVNCTSAVIAGSSTTNAQSDDFTVSTQSLSFLPATTTQPCNIGTTADTIFEGNEVFTVSAAGNANFNVVSGGPFTATITNDDGCAFAVSNVSQNEGNAGTSNFVHTVTKTCNTGAFTSFVNYAGTDGTATSPGDYTEIIPGQLAYLPADTTKPLPVSVNGDLTVEPDETYNVNITSATVNGVLVPTTTNGVGTILNDDGFPVSICGTVSQGGSPLGGVTMTLAGTSSGTTVSTSTATVACIGGGFGNYQFTGLLSGGNFAVTPDPSTPSGGRVYDPTARSFVGLTINAINQNFVGYNTLADVGRRVRFGLSSGAPGGTVVVPVRMDTITSASCASCEESVSGSFTHTSNLVPVSATIVGTDAAGGTITFNTVPAGTVSFVVNKPGGLGAAGTKTIALITFNVVANPPNTAANSPLVWTGVPTADQVRDANANLRPAQFVDGAAVFLQAGKEADVETGLNGDNDVDFGDAIEIGEFANHLVTGAHGAVPDFATSNEFQRADNEPAVTKGDGDVDLGDFIQGLRFANSLDPIQTAGGPVYPIPAPPPIAGERSDKSGAVESIPRNIRVGQPASGVQGGTVTVSIDMDAETNDKGLSFTLNFDPTKLSTSDAQVQLGSGAPPAPFLLPNTSQPGKVGVILAYLTNGLQGGGVFRQVVTIQFNILPTAVSGFTPLTFTDDLAVRQVRDLNNAEVAGVFTGGIVAIGPTAADTSVSGTVKSAAGRGIANARVSLTDSNGAVRTAISNGFGSFRIDGVATGETYILSVSAKRYTFAARSITVTDEIADIEIVSDN